MIRLFFHLEDMQGRVILLWIAVGKLGLLIPVLFSTFVAMLIIDDVLISEALFTEHFVCNLSKCKGICCIEGDFGAPLEEVERHTLERIYEDIKPFLRSEGIAEIERQGLYVLYEEERVYGTPLLEDGACAYLTFDEQGIALCGIELAWKAGVTGFRKPISCHLYPIRIKRNESRDFEAVNYEEWDICSDACSLGEQLRVPVFRFLREALVRKYGEAFYQQMEEAYQRGSF